MAKRAKVKEVWGYAAFQQEDKSWHWETGGKLWRFVEGTGANTFSAAKGEAWFKEAFFAKLKHAMYFSFGFGRGRAWERRLDIPFLEKKGEEDETQA